MNISSSVSFSEISKICENYSGADLQALLYNAQLETIHETIPNLHHEINNNEISEKNIKIFKLNEENEKNLKEEIEALDILENVIF